MKQTKHFVTILFVILGLGINLPNLYAQDNPNTITFDNKSGEVALVKLIGPTGQTVEVPNGQSRTVNAGAGEYYILVRYGSKSDQYSYSKGDPFTVTQTATQYSAITITLHKVVGGNYPIHPTSQKNFDQVKSPATVFTQSNDSTGRKAIKDDVEMVLVQSGKYEHTFKGEGSFDVQKAFYIDKYEVTNAKYKLFLDATGHALPPSWTGGIYPQEKYNYPVLVSWNDAQAYAKWAGKRLMSYAEWVAVASNPNTKKSPWMGKLDPIQAIEMYRVFQPKKSMEEFRDFVSEIGVNNNDKSPLGVYDLIGNALEWTSTAKISDEQEGKKSLSIKLVGYFVIKLPYMVDIAPLNAGPDQLFGFRCAKDISEAK